MNALEDVQKAIRSSDEEVRRCALQSLRGKLLQNVRHVLFYAMGDESWRVRKEAVEIFVSLLPEKYMVFELLELLRNDENAGLRNSAAEAVIRVGELATDALIEFVNDLDTDVRKFVVDMMGSIHSPAFIPSLHLALRDANVNVAAAAAEHLGNLGSPQSVHELIAAIIANDSDLLRFNALAAIGKLAVVTPVPGEITGLVKNDFLRKAVYECLGSIADESVVPLLLDGVALRQKSSRNAAVLALYRIYQRSLAQSRQNIETTLQSVKGSDLVTAIVDAFDLNDPALAEAVIVLLDVIGDKRGVNIFLQAFSNERLSEIALAALSNLGPAGIDTLISLFTAADAETRAAICSLIGECSYQSGINIIRAALCDQSPCVRMSAVTAIGTLGYTNLIPRVVPLLNDSSKDVRDGVVECLQALAMIDRSGILSVSNKLGESADPEQRRYAATLFASLGDVDRLALLVKDENALVRQAAVISMGKLHFEPASGILTLALVDENPDVRISAATALAEIGDLRAVTALTHALDDEDLWVQCAVLKSIFRISPEAIFNAVQVVFPRAEGLLLITCLKLLEMSNEVMANELIVQCLENADEEVVILALSIIGRRSPGLVIPYASRLLSHIKWDVRVACARTIALLPAFQAENLLREALEHETYELARAQLETLLKVLS